MNPKAPQLLAADANVALDLAQKNDWVLDALSTIRARLAGCSLLVPPTVSEELAWLADHAEESKTRADARKFLRHHRTWGFELVRATPLGDAYVEEVAARLLQSVLLPSTEANDAQILAESAALGCFILLTSDEHLRAVDFQRLGFELAAFDLAAPVIATPREVVRKFFR